MCVKSAAISICILVWTNADSAVSSRTNAHKVKTDITRIVPSIDSTHQDDYEEETYLVIPKSPHITIYKTMLLLRFSISMCICAYIFKQLMRANLWSILPIISSICRKLPLTDLFMSQCVRRHYEIAFCSVGLN